MKTSILLVLLAILINHEASALTLFVRNRTDKPFSEKIDFRSKRGYGKVISDVIPAGERVKAHSLSGNTLANVTIGSKVINVPEDMQKGPYWLLYIFPAPPEKINYQLFRLNKKAQAAAIAKNIGKVTLKSLETAAEVAIIVASYGKVGKIPPMPKLDVTDIEHFRELKLEGEI